MAIARTLDAQELSLRLPRFDALFEVARKNTVIQLRWPLVILCSYLLLYSPSSALAPGQTHAFLIFYLFSNATLYFVSEERFDSPYFYGPLLLFDTLFLTLSLALSGGATSDFYVACFLTLVLSCVCNDVRGLIVLTMLSPVLYGYIVFNSVATHDPSVYLRLPFPFVIAIFYGYFAQVERMKSTLKEREERIEQQRVANEQIRRQRERLEVLHEINLAVTSTLDLSKMLDTFLTKTLILLPYAAASVRLRDRTTGELKTVICKNIDAREYEEPADTLALSERVVEDRAPLMIRYALTDARIENPEFFSRQGLVSYLGVPLIAKGEILGVIAFYTRQEHEFSAEEIGFLLTLAGQAAIAIYNSQLFEQTKNQANELRSANRIKDEFLGVVSHELKTPLNVILGYTNMLVDGMLGETTPIQQKALQTVVRQSKELQNMINCVLQVSAIEAELLKPDMHEVNFWEFLYEIKSYYDYPLNKDIKLVWDFSSDLPTSTTDRSKLKHIVHNLINNAIKFTEKGVVTISARYVPAKKVMEFKVADTGVGIPKDRFSVIFERFRQLDSSETRAHGGVGLGLYIVKKYGDLLGATIHVESKPDHGSVFTLRVPCRHAKPSSICESSAASAGL